MVEKKDEAAGVSIVVPVLNEASGIESALQALAAIRAGGGEVVVVDGGSSDGTVDRARPLCDRVLNAPRGRGSQMNAGAQVASGDLLLFLHADTSLPAGAVVAIRRALAAGFVWGRFDVEIAGTSACLPLFAFMMNLRSRWSGIATGDQAIFVGRRTFLESGGFPDIPLMEDVAFSSRLRALARPACLRLKVLTSGRRWEKNGVARTMLLMWWLRLRFFCGADPEKLAIAYGYRSRES